MDTITPTMRTKLMLAHGIVTYQSTIEALLALRKTGHSGMSDYAFRAIQRDQNHLLYEWMVRYPEDSYGKHEYHALGPEGQIKRIRRWLTEHIDELDALLRKEGDDR